MIEIILSSFIALIAFLGAGLIVVGIIRAFRPRRLNIVDYPELPAPSKDAEPNGQPG
jgi:hypothetical protein